MNKELIPFINLEVSINTYYDLLKAYTPSFGWSFVLPDKDFDNTQLDLLKFLSEQTAKNQLGDFYLNIWCTKIGNVKTKKYRVERIDRITDHGYKISETY